MGPLHWILILAWAAGAAVALTGFAVILRRRSRLEPESRPSRRFAYRAPALLMIVATAGVLAPSVLIELVVPRGTRSGPAVAPPLLDALSAAVAGWLLLITAALMIAWGVGDPARGRKRCRRCWYDMSAATGLTCPECGRTGRTERDLLRTRRQRRLLSAAFLGTIAAGAVWVAPGLRDGTWPRRSPAILTAILLPLAPDRGAIIREWERRYGEHGDGVAFAPEPVLLASARLTLRSPEAERTRYALLVLSRRNEAPADLAPRLLALLESKQNGVPSLAARALAKIPSAHEEALNKIFDLLPSSPVVSLPMLLQSFAAHVDPSVSAPAVLFATARDHSDRATRAYARYVIVSFAVDDRTRLLARDSAVAAEYEIRLWGLDYLHDIDPSCDIARHTRLAALQDVHPLVRQHAARQIGTHGPFDDPEVLQMMLADSDEMVLEWFVTSLSRERTTNSVRLSVLQLCLEHRRATGTAIWGSLSLLDDPRSLLPLIREIEAEAVADQDAQLFATIKNILAVIGEPLSVAPDAVPEPRPRRIPPPAR